MINESKARAIGLFVLVAFISVAAAQTTTAAPPATDPCIGQPDGFLPHPSECTKYFSCYGGKGYEQVCPDGKFFDPARQLCDVAANVNCIVNNCPPDGVEFLPIPGVCDRYTICVGGEAFEGICDEGLYFDQVQGDCNYKNESGCVVNPCIQPPPSPPTLEIYPNDADCETYVICLNGEPIIRNCADGLFFDPAALQCVVATECPAGATTDTTVDPTTAGADSTVDPTTAGADTTVDTTTEQTTLV